MHINESFIYLKVLFTTLAEAICAVVIIYVLSIFIALSPTLSINFQSLIHFIELMLILSFIVSTKCALFSISFTSFPKC